MLRATDIVRVLNFLCNLKGTPYMSQEIDFALKRVRAVTSHLLICSHEHLRIETICQHQICRDVATHHLIV